MSSSTPSSTLHHSPNSTTMDVTTTPQLDKHSDKDQHHHHHNDDDVPTLSSTNNPSVPMEPITEPELGATTTTTLNATSEGNNTGAGHEQPVVVMTKVRFALVYASMLTSIFLFALDQLIIATAIPKITDRFHSLSQISWLANGFFITLLAFNLIYSQWLLIFPTKDVILFAIVVFEVGSAICAWAGSMQVLILGRAVAGLGASGLFSANIILLAEITTMKTRGMYMAGLGVVFAIASVLGPLVGGLFSDSSKLTWRGCFWINLPFGGIALAAMIVFLPRRPPLGNFDTYKGYGRHMFWQLAKCDWLGVAIVLGWAVCFILALEWGGATKPWSDGSVIACLVMIPVLGITFILWEWWIGPNRAMLLLSLFKRRTITAAAMTSLWGFALFMAAVYYISLDYQAVYNKSATNAGVRLLPMIMTQIVFLIGSARVIAKTGRYYPVILAGPIFLTIGSGLLFSTNENTPIGTMMGYSSLVGVGIGLFLQNVLLAAQYDLRLEPKLIGRGVGVLTFMGFIGRLMGISVGGTIFANQLRHNLAVYVPELPSEAAAALVGSASAIWDSVPDSLRPMVLKAYTMALSDVFVVGIAYGILALFSAAWIKNVKMDTSNHPAAASKNAAEKEERDSTEMKKEAASIV